jgi:hypothetical protein
MVREHEIGNGADSRGCPRQGAIHGDPHHRLAPKELEVTSTPDVAILLATYNGARHIEAQIGSLVGNRTPFTLHWLDDQSKDDTRNLVRSAAAALHINLVEWHRPERLGVPKVFFQLLRRVEANVYLFCDQDDIWQPGKIDATVDNLTPDLGSPVLCFSDSLIWHEGRHGRCYHHRDIIDSVEFLHNADACQMFIPSWSPGHSQGFTRALRDVFCTHADIAENYASMHDMWMYNIAVASGVARVLCSSPVAFSRQNDGSACGQVLSKARGLAGAAHIAGLMRRSLAWHASGFLLASATLPRGPQFASMLQSARILSKIDKRQSLADLVRLSSRDIRLFRRFRGRFFDVILGLSLFIRAASIR